MRIEMILAYSYVAITVLGLSIAVKWFGNKRLSSIAGGFAVTVIMIVHLLIFHVENIVPGSIPSEVMPYYNAPLWVTLVLPTLVFMHSLTSVLFALRRRSRTVSRSSIREAVNEMECGLMYTESDGTIILMNRVMASMAKRLTGREVHDGEKFWRFIISFEESRSAKRIDFSAGPALLFMDGSVWSFQRAILKDTDRKFIEIVARNVTDLYERTEDMKREINELSMVQSEMYKVLQNISETGNKEELLNYKVRIHDSLGNAVLRIRQILRSDNPTDEETRKVIGIWDSTVKAYRNNSLGNTNDSMSNYESLLKLADTLGIELTIKGNFPTSSELAIRAVREAMYNSIRHAYANKVMVDSYKSREGYHLHICDDGHASSPQIKEGGGLSSLRKTIEASGGTMEVTVNDGVELNIFVREGAND